MHFLQESYKFVQESQFLHLVSQDSDNIFAKFASIRKKFLQKIRCVIFHSWVFEQKINQKCVQGFFGIFRYLFE